MKKLLPFCLLMACGPTLVWQPPPEPRTIAPPPPGEENAELSFFDDDATQFAELSARILKDMQDASPVFARTAGHHEYDGKVADYSAAGIDRQIAAMGTALAKLRAIDPSGLTPNQALDREILMSKLILDRFDLSERELHRTTPVFYTELFDVSIYIDFDYAPLEQRALRLVEHQEAALLQADHVLANLKPTLSRPIVETAISIYKGYAEYLSKDVPRLVGSLGDDAYRDRFTSANTRLAAKARAIATALEKDFLPRSDTTSHVLGRERYLKFVAAQEGRPIALAEFKAMAEKNLADNKRAYEQLLPKVKITRPSSRELLAAATKQMNDSRDFIIAKKLATIPSEDRCTLKETPPYMRWNAAFLNMPGPYDTAKQAFYYITLPDPSWPADEQRDYIFPYGILMATTVHEVYPGHFLHGLWIRNAPTDVQKSIHGYSFTEGYAHYAEEMMVEQGFGAEDPQNRLGQLSDALLRNCRFVVSIGVHAEGMTMEQAEQRFMTDCYQDKATARQQAKRATFDPGYFAYTVGKVQILELRAEAQRRLGERFDLGRFHDALLSHGAPPVALIHDRVLQQLE